MPTVAYAIIRLVVTIIVAVATIIVFAVPEAPAAMKDIKTHGILMICSIIVAMGLAITSFKNLPFSHAVAKIVHAVGNLIALALMLAGFAVVYDFKEKAATPTHFAMTHSWVGMLTIVLMISIFLIGAIVFNDFVDFPPEEIRRDLKPIHKYLGIGVFVLGGVNIAAGLCIYREMVVLESVVNVVSLLCILSLFVVLFTLVLRKPVKQSK